MLMEEVIQKCEINVKPIMVGYRNLISVRISECVFADDLVILGGREKDLRYNMTTYLEINNGNIWCP